MNAVETSPTAAYDHIKQQQSPGSYVASVSIIYEA